MMTSQVCVDASLIVALLVPERFSDAVWKLWREWVMNDWQITAPMLMRYEVTSALYRKALQGQIANEDARAALERFLELDIEWVDPVGLPQRATELAAQFKRPNTYDAHYLALAEHLECVFWTGDRRLYNVTKDELNNVFWIGDHLESVLR